MEPDLTEAFDALVIKIGVQRTTMKGIIPWLGEGSEKIWFYFGKIHLWDHDFCRVDDPIFVLPWRVLVSILLLQSCDGVQHVLVPVDIFG